MRLPVKTWASASTGIFRGSLSMDNIKNMSLKSQKLCVFLNSRNELHFFNKMTTKVTDPARQNAVIMGRNTYFGIPPAFRPLPNRLNIILSRKSSQSDYPAGVLLCSSLDEAMELLEQQYSEKIENIWIVGGSAVYKEAMESLFCHRIYFTDIQAHFECDTFFPAIDLERFQRVANDEDVPVEIQEENGVKYEYQIFEKIF